MPKNSQFAVQQLITGKQMISAVDKNQIYLYSGIAQGSLYLSLSPLLECLAFCYVYPAGMTTYWYE